MHHTCHASCQLSQEKMKSRSPDCNQKATEPTYELNGCENNLTQCGVDTLGLLLLYKIDPELTRATHVSVK